MKYLTCFLAFAVFTTNTCLDASEQQLNQTNDSSEQNLNQQDARTQSLIADFHKTETLKQELKYLEESRIQDQTAHTQLDYELTKIESAEKPSISPKRLSQLREVLRELKQNLPRKKVRIEQMRLDLHQLKMRRSEFEKEVRNNPTKENLMRKMALLEAEVKYFRKQYLLAQQKNKVLGWKKSSAEKKLRKLENERATLGAK